MKTAIVIPARFDSSRLPGKPLKLICGRTMLERVWRIASAVNSVDRVIIATDDQRIYEAAKSFGAEVVMTPNTCRNGSERVFAAISEYPEKFAAVLNFQGDAPLTLPAILQALVDQLKTGQDGVVTPAVQISSERYEQLKVEMVQAKPGRTGTFVVFDNNNHALYFSRSLIPAVRNGPTSNVSPVFQHIGIYGYLVPALRDYISLPESRLEKLEGLEQLRLLENSRKIKVVPVDLQGRSYWSVDNEADILKVEEIIKQEGELL